MANFTERAIKASFIKLLNDRPLSKISVKDIVEDCGINRNSFYYHFQDIPSLLTEIITELTEEIIQKYPEITSLEECFRVAFRLAQENRRAVLHIYNSVSRDLFLQNTMRLCGSTVEAYMKTAFPDDPMAAEDREVLVRFLKCQLFGMVVDWVSSGMKDEALSDLERIISLCRGIPELIVQRSIEEPRT